MSESIHKRKIDEQTQRQKRRIRSYVLRQSRMSNLQQRAYDGLFPQYGFTYDPNKVITGADYPKNNPLIIEIGFGMGHATAEIARKRPDRNFLGIEVHSPGVGALLARIEENNLQNLKVIQHDAIPVLIHMIPQMSIEGIHLFFPDPWPKKRHKKRRIFQSSLLSIVSEKLIPEGYVYAVTDWEDYAQQMLETSNNHPDFTNAYHGSFASDIEWRPQTAFERKGLAKNHRIYELFIQKRRINIQ
ncbi:tRNA (guanosine(46)-N7)-methyltransferase TrmB [Spirochaeta lutea]|uniref:tRNA (guanine-N(7)-)-methyltransferase n=1 Tax=Spirochaeta lutea TaxID=1480694 RepID=A0A098R1Z2_9SPIO|nr:tRNA (guanosine(46)-N7)-methyltransferase TrmB [Spirochaeta lutea]KGE73683.1 hypothetical protein DC28_00100 [Spirochaeta lutea]